MPTVRDWVAATDSGSIVRRDEAPGRQVPEDARELAVETDTARVRAVVRAARGERLRVVTRRRACIRMDGGEGPRSPDTPIIELAVGGAVVRLFVKGDEFVLSTEDLADPAEVAALASCSLVDN